MATNKNITMRQFNGTDYDTLYPKTLGSQIASTVPVSAGGTGINVNPNIHVNLGAENTSNVFEVYPRPGVYGTLPVSHGGTGQTSLAALASAMGAAKIQTGSYVGTGTYGASNPNSLTFNGVPKLFFCGYRDSPNDVIQSPAWIMWYECPVGRIAGPRYVSSSYIVHLQFSRTNTTLQWYWYAGRSDYAAAYQGNSNGVSYDYVVILG